MPRGDDIRSPSRKVFNALTNLEMVVGTLPIPRVRMVTRLRSNFPACGETSTYTKSYSGVPWRSLASLPRMAKSVNDSVTGITSPADEDVVFKETKTNGHPVSWKEMIDVEWYLVFFKDTNACCMLDTTPGSGAAACAAAILEIPYEGYAMSSKHTTWLDNIMDKAIFAPISKREIKDAKGKTMHEAKHFQEQVVTCFKDLVEEGRKYVERDARAAEEEEIVEEGVDGKEEEE